MIRITKEQCPNVLEKYAADWLKDYIAACSNLKRDDTEENRKRKTNAERKYNHQDIKEALKKDFAGKCAYCESYIIHVDFGHIEHFKPKSKYPDLCFEWENLLLACSICNGTSYKGSKFPLPEEGGPFVNPVTENPNHFFNFVFDKVTGTATLVAKNKRGETTLHELGLNRNELVEYRSKRVQQLAFIAIKAYEGEQKAKELLQEAAQSGEEYAAFARMLMTRFNIPYNQP